MTPRGSLSTALEVPQLISYNLPGTDYQPTPQTARRGGRVAEGNGLLNRRRLTPYRGFKSRPLRHLLVVCSIVKMPAGSR